MEIINTREELIQRRMELAVKHHDRNFERPLVGLTPTMGALHEGHISLIRRMTAECDVSIVSIFVNPAQFGAGEDYEEYPRDMDADLAACRNAGVHLAYVPPEEVVYPEGFQTTVRVGALTERWCGASRSGHFEGVTTVVAKLLNACLPDRAYFGEKDYQQYVVIRRMAADLEMPVQIVPCPIVREHDGLAMSSRNIYLSEAERSVATRLYKTLKYLDSRFASGERSATHLVDESASILNPGGGPQFNLEYLAVVDPRTLEPRTTAQTGDRVLIAARLGNTRLIDNISLTGKEGPG